MDQHVIDALKTELDDAGSRIDRGEFADAFERLFSVWLLMKESSHEPQRLGPQLPAAYRREFADFRRALRQYQAKQRRNAGAK